MRLVVVGGIALDYLSKVKDLKQPFAQVTEYGENIGGMGYNTALCAARLGIDTRLVSAVGRDFNIGRKSGKLLLDLDYTDSPTTRSFLFYDDEDERIYFYCGSYHEIDVRRAIGAISHADWVHFAGVAPCFSEIIKAADAEGKIISCNPGYDIFHYEPTDATVKTLVEKSDYMILSSREAEQLNKPIDSIVNGAVIVTMGKNGSVLVEKGKRTQIDAYPVEKKSPFGAGDVYSGTFISAMLLENELLMSAKLASAAASFAVEEKTTTPELDWEKIKKRAKKL